MRPETLSSTVGDTSRSGLGERACGDGSTRSGESLRREDMSGGSSEIIDLIASNSDGSVQSNEPISKKPLWGSLVLPGVRGSTGEEKSKEKGR